MDSKYKVSANGRSPDECTTVVSELCSLYEKHKGQGDCIIPLARYHNLLARGDVEMVKEVLAQLPSPEMKNFVLNAIVACEEQRVKKEDKDATRAIMEDFRLPLVLAVYSDNEELVRLLLAEGTSLLTSDEYGNIVHRLVLLSQSLPEQATKFYKMFMGMLSVDEMTSILSEKNRKRQSPLDLAINKSTLLIMDAIVHTCGMYRFPQEQVGVYQNITYKLPQINCALNSHCSILDCISDIGERDLITLETVGIMSRQPFQNLMNHHKRTYLIGILKMLVLHIFITVVSFLQSYYFLNDQDPITWLTCLGFIAAILCIICEIRFLTVQWRNIFQFLKQWWVKNPSVIVVFPMRLVFHIVLFFFVYCCIEEFMGKRTRTPLIQATFYLPLSYVFYFQYFPRMASMILMAMNMIKDTFVFMILGFSVYAAYALGFWTLHYNMDDPVDQADNVQQCEPLMFQGFQNSIYEVILLSTSVISPTSIYFPGSVNLLSATSMYVGCVVVWSVLLLNLLIAIYSERVAHVNQHELSVMQLHELNMMLYVVSFIRANALLYEPVEFIKRRKRNVADTQDFRYIEVMEKIDVE